MTGKLIIEEKARLNFRENIAHRSKKCTDMGVAYSHVVFPSKPIILYAYLPRNMEGSFLFDMTTKKLGVLYPLETLDNSKYIVFQKRDTHMNSY